MKKFISVMAVVAMLLSLCAVNVGAATSANPIINVHSEKYDGTDAPANYKPGDYDVYKVWYTTEGIDVNDDIVVGLEIKFSVDDDSKIDSKSWSESKTSGKTSERDANGVYNANVPPTLMQKGYFAFSNVVAGIDVFDWDTYGDGGTQETLPYIETLIYVTAGEQVTFTYSTTESILAIDSTDRDNERNFSTELQYKVNGVAGNVLVLGEAEEQDTATYEEPTQALEKFDGDTINLKDADGKDVTLTKKYAIATFSTLYSNDKKYSISLTPVGGGEAEDFEINFADKDIEVSNGVTVTFSAIARSLTKVVDTMKLKIEDK